MTKNTKETKADSLEYAADAVPQPAVRTDWASDERMEASPSFDLDQADVNAWVNALPETREAALERTMTLADAEELIATCESVAKQHEVRAGEARSLAATVAQRLGRSSDKFAGEAMVGAVRTPTRAMPTVGGE